MTARNKTLRGKPRISNLLGERARRDFLLQAAAGQIPGISTFHVFGYDTDLTNTIKLIYPVDTPFVYPSVDQPLKIASNDLEDNYRGTGARIIRIVGLDFNGNIQTEDVIMRGFTVVRSLGNYRRLLTAYVLSSGSLNGTQGSIFLFYEDNTFAGEIASPFNVVVNGNFTVPVNTNAYIYAYGFSMGAPKELSVGVRATSPDRINPNWVMLDFKYCYGGTIDEELQLPFMLTEGIDVELVGFTQANSNTHISAYMDLLLVDKEYDWGNPLLAEERHSLEKVE